MESEPSPRLPPFAPATDHADGNASVMVAICTPFGTRTELSDGRTTVIPNDDDSVEAVEVLVTAAPRNIAVGSPPVTFVDPHCAIPGAAPNVVAAKAC